MLGKDNYATGVFNDLAQMNDIAPYSKWEDVGLNDLTIHWKWVFGMVGFWAILALLPNVVLGVAFFVLWFFTVQRKWGRREAIVSLFLVTCVLANSREPEMQFWKMFRIVAAGLLWVEGLKVCFQSELEERRKWMTWGCILVVCTILPSLISTSPGEGLFQSVLIVTMWFVMLILSKVNSDESKSLRANSLMHLALVVVLISILAGFLEWRLAFLQARFRGIFGNPNSISHWWLMFFILGLSGTTSLRKSKSLGLVLLTGVVLYWGASRGAALACLVALTGWVWLRSSLSILQKMLVFGVLAILLSGVQYATVDMLNDILPAHMVRAENIQGGGGRFLAWEHAWNEIMKSPWVGHGGGYEERYFESSYHYFTAMNHQGLSHNSWIAFSMNYGVPQALLLIIGLLVYLGLFRSKYRMIALIPAVLSFSIEGYLTAPMSAVSPAMIFVCGFLGSFKRNPPTQNTE